VDLEKQYDQNELVIQASEKSEDDYIRFNKKNRIESFMFLDGIVDRRQNPDFHQKTKQYQSQNHMQVILEE
jgi:hypothetical protein